MANETTTTSADDVFLAAQVTAEILEEIRPNNVTRPLFREERLTMSNSYDFPIQDDPGASAAKTEGTDLSNTSLTTSKATATAATVGIMATITDELRAISMMEAIPHFSSVLARSTLEKLETDLAAKLDDGSNSTGTTLVDLTVATFLTGAAALLARDITGPRVFVGGPDQITDLQQDMAAALSPWTGKQADEAVDYGNGPTPAPSFALAGIPCYQTSTVPTANAGADVVGSIFVPNQSFGSAYVWDPRVELQRDASNVATESVSTARYGAVQIRDSDAQEILSDKN